jgi:ABC-type phosphate/phosphonate transport system substrate-binding protein
MSEFIAALPMYDWPETRSETDAEWARLRPIFSRQGIDAPASLVRRNGDMPPVPGGIRSAFGRLIAPDPATLPENELDIPTLWAHPKLIFGQTCWGPMELGLAEHVRVLGQPDYSEYPGGEGRYYSSAILMRRADAAKEDIPPPTHGTASIPLEQMVGTRFAFNSLDSMSGLIALTRDIEETGTLIGLFSETVETGGHRASVKAVADGKADVCAIDCRSWALAQRFDPHARTLAVVGWTRRRKGLPYIAALGTPAYSLSSSTSGAVSAGLT